MDVASLPYKVGEFVDGKWKEYRHHDEFQIEGLENGKDRLTIGAADPFPLVLEIAKSFSGPVSMTVCLHTPREKDRGGRYESPPMPVEQALSFLAHYRAAFERDARADFRLRCTTSGDELVYDKHDYVVFTGSASSILPLLESNGFVPGLRGLPFPHTHHYRDEFDLDFVAMLDGDWTWNPLVEGDGD